LQIAREIWAEGHISAARLAVMDRALGPKAVILGRTADKPCGAAFVALHGSWNRAQKTGYKVVRLKFRDGQPTGEYQDFLTGFVRDNTHVWGRPAGVAVASDGSLLVSDDVSGTIWRVIYDKR
jgi:glucose/arabinose dehydrogenase